MPCIAAISSESSQAVIKYSEGLTTIVSIDNCIVRLIFECNHLILQPMNWWESVSTKKDSVDHMMRHAVERVTASR